MHLIGHVRAHAATLIFIIIVSTCVLVSIEGGFKVVHVSKGNVSYKKRDSTAITLNVPGKSALEDGGVGAPVLGTVGDAATGVADAALQAESNAANAASQGKNKLVSVAISKGHNIVSFAANILDEASAAIGIVIDDSPTSSAASSVAVESHPGPCSSSSPNTLPFGDVTPPLASSLSKFLAPMSSISCTSQKTSGLNSTLPTSLQNTFPSSSSSSIDASSTYCCPPPPMPTSKPVPGPTGVTCTITETWYSFMSTLTVSVCPPPEPFSFGNNATTSLSSPLSSPVTSHLSSPLSSPPFSSIHLTASSPLTSTLASLITCANGDLAAYAKDCPPLLTSSNPADSISKDCASSSTSIFGSLSISNPMLTSPIENTTPTAAPSGPLTSGQIPPATATPRPSYLQNQEPSLIGSPTSLDVTVVVNSALSNIDGLTGNLLSTVVAQVNSVIALVNKAPGALPSGSLNLGVGFDKDKLPGLGGVFGKDIKAVNSDGRTDNLVDEGAAVDDTSLNAPAATFLVNPFPVEQPTAGNDAALANALTGAGTRRRKFAGDRRET